MKHSNEPAMANEPARANQAEKGRSGANVEGAMTRPIDVELSELYLTLYSGYYYTDGDMASDRKVENLTELVSRINSRLFLF